jgi:hypothetical protein
MRFGAKEPVDRAMCLFFLYFGAARSAAELLAIQVL